MPAFTPAFASNLAGPYAAGVRQVVTAVTVHYTKGENTDPDPVITPADSDDGQPGHQVDLTAGRETTITVRLTSQGGQLSTTYTMVVTRQSDEARLSAIGITYGDPPTAVPLDRPFDPEQPGYHLNVPNSVTQFTVTHTTRDSHTPAPIILIGTFCPPSDGSSSWVPCNEVDEDGVIDFPGTGDRIMVLVEVTSEDGTNSKTYNLDIRRRSTNSNLIRVMVGATEVLVARFTGDPPTHTLTIPSAEREKTVAALPADEFATVEYQYYPDRTDTATPVADADPEADGFQIAELAVGENLVLITIRAEDASAQSNSYYLVLDRQSADATLSNLDLSDVTLDPSFVPGTLVYRASVANSVMQTTVTPTLNDNRASYEIKLGQAVDDEVIDLAVGDNVITVTVSAEDPTVETRTYRVVVRRMSADATLRDLSLSGVTLVPPFVPGTVDYTASVATSVTQTTVTAAATHRDASYVIKLNDVEDADGVIDLAEGENVITVEVTAEDTDATETYTVTVIRAAPDTTPPGVTIALDSEAPWLLKFEFSEPVSGFGEDDITVGDGDKWHLKPASLTPDARGEVFTAEIVPAPGFRGPLSVSIPAGAASDGAGNPSPAASLDIEDLDTGPAVLVYLEPDTDRDGVRESSELRIGDFRARFVFIENNIGGDAVTDFEAADITVGNGSVVTDSLVTDAESLMADVVFDALIRPNTGCTPCDVTVSVPAGVALDANGKPNVAAETLTVRRHAAALDVTTPYVSSLAIHRDSNYRSYSVGMAFSEDIKGLEFGEIVLTNATMRPLSYAGRYYEFWLDPINAGEVKIEIAASAYTDTGGAMPAAKFEFTFTAAERHVPREPRSARAVIEEALDRQPGGPPPSTDATLSGLAISDVNLGPFDPATTRYTAEVANGVDETTVTPATNDGGATYAVKLGGVVDDDGVIPLAVGGNVITIEVTAEDGNATRTYTVTVTRAGPPATGPTATIDLSPSGAVTEGTEITVTLSFANLEFDSDTSTTDYIFRADVVDADECENQDNDYGLGVERYMYKVDEDPEIRTGAVSAACPAGNYTVRASIASPDNVELASASASFSVVEPAPEPTLSTDATLSNLALSDVNLGAFASGTTRYTASVPNDVTQTTVTPTTNHDGASYVIKLDGMTDAGTVALAVGSNVITIEVTAEDGDTAKTYTVTVTRAAPDATAPDAPDRPTGQSTGEGAVSLDWNHVPSATSYAVRVWQVDAYTELSADASVNGISITFNGSSATVSGLPTDYEWYFFQVSAINDAGASGWSPNNAIQAP